MTHKEIAERINQILDSDYDRDDLRHLLYQLHDKIEPPKPKRFEPGTVVRSAVFGDRDDIFGICTSEGVFWASKSNKKGHVNTWEHVPADHYKPVRILADDEVAVKRSVIEQMLGESDDIH